MCLAAVILRINGSSGTIFIIVMFTAFYAPVGDAIAAEVQ